MKIQPHKSLSFRYSNPLKTLYKKGQLKSVKTGFYGGELTKKNVTLEHLKPHSKGGKTELSNLVLATDENNRKRGNKPLKDFLNPENVKKYLEQFKGIELEGFNGNRYIRLIKETLRRIYEREHETSIA